MIIVMRDHNLGVVNHHSKLAECEEIHDDMADCPRRPLYSGCTTAVCGFSTHFWTSSSLGKLGPNFSTSKSSLKCWILGF